MTRGLFVSILLHAALLGWALLTIQQTAELHPVDESRPISVEILTQSELTRIRQGDDTSKHLEAKASEQPPVPDPSKLEADKPKPPPPPPPAPVAAAEPTPPEPTPPEPPAPDPIEQKLAALPPAPEVTPPPPGPTPEEQAALMAKVEAEKKAAEEVKKAEEKRKAEVKKKVDEAKRKKAEEARRLAVVKAAEAAKKRQFDADRILALIDKSPDKPGGPSAANPPPSQPTTYKGPTAGQRDGHDAVLTARETDILKGMIKSQLTPCSKLPGGGGGLDTPVVSLKWRLNQDGSLNGEPVVLNQQGTDQFRIAAEAAVRAVKTCQPFAFPADKYAAWSTINWDFDWPAILGLKGT